jgi:hypothetical protein
VSTTNTDAGGFFASITTQDLNTPLDSENRKKNPKKEGKQINTTASAPSPGKTSREDAKSQSVFWADAHIFSVG